MLQHDFKDKVYVVTGASSGMGRACCEKLLASGAKVVGLDRSAGTIENNDYTHKTVDVTDENEVKSAFKNISDIHGTISGLVNAAGVFGNNKPFYELGLDEWNKVIGINTTGTFITSKYASQMMIPKKIGKIVNISCIRSVIYKTNMADYAASKGAVSSMTSAMALDLAPHNIQVNAVAPGFIYTGMTADSFDIPEIKNASEALIPAERIGTAEDIASVVLFLLSPASDYITGTVVFADGGYHIAK